MGITRDINTLKAIRDRLVSSLQEINSEIDARQGTVVKDVLDSVATELRNQNVATDYAVSTRNLDSFIDIAEDAQYVDDLRVALSLATSEEVTDLISRDLTEVAASFGVTRKPAVSAMYVQRFYRADNNSGSPLTIPIGTQVSTRDGAVTCVTTTSLPQVPKYDSAAGLYYVEETVMASQNGSVGNVSLNSLTTITPQLSVAPFAKNVSVVRTGVDTETDRALIDRLKTKRKGQNYPTAEGLRNWAIGTLEDSPISFTDASVVGPGNALMYRAPAGAIDLYVVGKDYVTSREVIRYVSGQTAYIVSVQPVASIASVTGASGAVPYTFNLDTNTSGFAGSTKAQTGFTITSVTGLTNNDAMTVEYTYDAAIRDAQDLIYSADGTWTIPGYDILVKQGVLTEISIDLEIIAFGDRPLAEVEADIESDLAAFFNGGTASTGTEYAPKRLGERIDRSDVIAVVTAVSDVDRVTITGVNSLVFYKDGVQTSDDPITLMANQYARLGTVTFL